MSSVNNLRPVSCFNIYEVVYFYNEITREPDMRRDLLGYSYFEADANESLAELSAENPLCEYMVEAGTIYE